MKSSETILRHAIDAFMRARGMSRSAFGQAAMKDPSFLGGLDDGRTPGLATADRLLVFMGLAPMGPAFRCEVAAFLEITGVKRSEFGLAVTGSRSLAVRVLRGASLRLSTVDGARAWMAAQASAEEARRIRARVAEVAAAGHCPVADGCSEGDDAMSDDGNEYMSTREAAAFLGLSHRTLDRYRVTGKGPEFNKFGSRVRYWRPVVEAWAAARRRRSTSDDGSANRQTPPDRGGRPDRGGPPSRRPE